MKTVFLFEILLAINLVTANLHSAEYQLIGEFTYNFTDGLYSSEFLTSGRPFSYKIGFAFASELPPLTIYHYYMFCSTEHGGNWTDYEHFNPVKIENSWVESDSSSAYFGKKITNYSVTNGFLLPTDKEFRSCTIQSKEFYYIDNECESDALRNNISNTTHCKIILPISVYESHTFQVYSETAYSTQLQFLQQEKQHEKDLEQLRSQMQQQKEQHEKELKVSEDNTVKTGIFSILAALLGAIVGATIQRNCQKQEEVELMKPQKVDWNSANYFMSRANTLLLAGSLFLLAFVTSLTLPENLAAIKYFLIGTTSFGIVALLLGIENFHHSATYLGGKFKQYKLFEWPIKIWIMYIVSTLLILGVYFYTGANTGNNIWAFIGGLLFTIVLVIATKNIQTKKP